jgi:hypothetical protein
MWNLAQTYTYNTNTSANTGLMVVLVMLYLVILVGFIAASWKIFTKAGQAGWKAIIPVYNTVITCRIIGISGWYTLLIFVPLVNVFFAIYVAYKLAQSFGYDIGMTILELLVIGYFILGFGKAKYLGPGGKKAPGKSSAA